MDTLLPGEFHQLAVLQQRMDFHLVGGDFVHAHGFDGLAQMGDGEVGRTDGRGQTLTLGFQQLAQILRHGNLIVRRRPVDQRQVDPLQAQALQALAQAGRSPGHCRGSRSTPW